MRRLSIVLFSFLLFTSLSHAEYFGKNKVQYKDFEWKVMKTDHFEIYFYQGEEYLANFVSEVVESAYERLESDFRKGLSKPVPVIVYNSHNDFQQTNVISELLEESVGGFTEVLKNRVVVPFTGSYGDLEKVITHELVHAFQFDILYGRGTGSLITKVYQIELPTWIAEGMAQFLSKEWDTESDMILRDLTVSEKLYPITQLEHLSGSYLLYAEGESILRFIEEKYGREKVFELFYKFRKQINTEKAVKATFGLTIAEFDREWQRWLKSRYWPLVGEKELLETYGRALTEHSKDGSILNVSPKLSPNADKIAYISDRSGYSDLYVISALDGTLIKHLVKGGRSSGFESIHIHRGGIGWSSEATEIVFVGKSQGKDIVYIMDVDTGKLTKRLEFALDGIYSPDWSPTGDAICFVGLKDGASDLYLYDLKTQKLTRLTNDRYDERDPSWSPTGEFIAFTSDRGEFAGRYALFTMKSDGSEIRKASFRSNLVSSPCWSEDGRFLIFISDLNGTPNIYRADIEGDSCTQLTDVLTGITSVDWVGNRMVFCGFHDVGWDLYVAKDPLELVGEMVTTEEESWRKEEFDLHGGDRQVEKCGVRLSPDWIVGGISYSTAYGLSGQSEILISDILGNHQIYLVSDLIQNIEESNFSLVYFYLPKRIDYGFAIFQEKYYYLLLNESAEILSERDYGAACFMSYPFDKFRRIDLELDSYFRERTLYEYSDGIWSSYGQERRFVIVPYLSAVYDNTKFGVTGPIDGLRYNLTYGKSIGLSSNALQFSTFVGDLRKYWRITDRYSFATRLVHAYAKGRDAERFWIGGSEDLRGYGDYSFAGYYVGFLNMELRYPFIDQFNMAFPLPIEIRNLRGVLFMDCGVACDSPAELVLTERKDGGLRLKDLKLGFGAGIRFPISFLIIKLDFAKNTNLQDISGKTYVHFSLGSDF